MTMNKTEKYKERQRAQTKIIEEARKNRLAREERNKLRRVKEREEAAHAERIAEPEAPPKAWVGMSTGGLEYDEGVVPPKLNTSWPWVLEEITQRKSDNKIIAHKLTGMNTSSVSKIRMHYGTPEQHLSFRRGKPLAMEFEDATTTMKLSRQNQSTGNIKRKMTTITNMKEAAALAAASITADEKPL